MPAPITAFLTWSERYIKTDMSYVATNGFWLLLNQAFSFLLSLASLWVFTNVLDQAVYGEYRFLTTVLSILSLASLSGMGIAVTRSVARGDRGVLLPALRQKIIWGLIGSGSAVIGSGYYFWQGDQRLGSAFLLIALAVPLIDTFTTYTAYLNGLKDFKRFALYRLFQRAGVILAVILAIIFSGDILYIVGAFILSTILLDGILLYWSVQKHPLNEKNDTEALSYGKHLSLISVFRLGAQHLDKICLWYFTGPVAVASYVVAVAIPQELMSASGQISKLALPKMSARSKVQLRQSLLRKTFLFGLATIPLVLVYIAGAPFLFNFFFPQYSSVILYSQIASLIVLFSANSLLSQYFYATQNKRALYLQNTIEPLVLLTLYAALIPTFGIIGALIATITRHAFITAVWLWLFIIDPPDPKLS